MEHDFLRFIFLTYKKNGLFSRLWKFQFYLFLDSAGTSGSGPGEAAPAARRRAYMVQGKG